MLSVKNIETLKNLKYHKNITDTKNVFIKEINQNELMSKKNKNVSTTLNVIEHLLILASTDTRCVSIYAYASLFDIPIDITSSEVRLKICAIAPGIISQ